MAPKDRFEPIVLSGPKAVDVKAVERELTALWEEAARGPEDGPAIMRACALNVIVVAFGSRMADEVAAIIARLLGRHPCRAIVLRADPEAAESGLQAWVSAHCQLPTAGGKQICCEQITLSAQGEAVGELPGTVLPLLVSDLPVFLWWPGDLSLEDELFNWIAAMSDRVIVDSSAFQAPEVVLKGLSTLIEGPSRRAAFGDLNWIRLTSWRELAAQFFDPPDLRPSLDRIAEVLFEYGALDLARPNPAQALLLTGWLASRLGWQPREVHRHKGGHHRFVMRKGGRTIIVEVRPTPPRDHVDGSLVSFTLVTEGPPARFVIARAEDRVCVETEVEVEGRRAIRRVVRMEDPSLAELVGRELDLLGHDVVYEEALKMGGALTGPR